MDDEIRIVDNPGARRYEAHMGDRLAGFADYRALPGRIVFIHTEVLPEFEGRGVGSRLAAGALDDVRAQGLGMTPQCPFIAAYVRRHPEYADLVREAAPGDRDAREGGDEAPGQSRGAPAKGRGMAPKRPGTPPAATG